MHAPSGRLTTLASTDLDQARELVARIFCPHGLYRERGGTDIHYRHRFVRLGALCLNEMTYGGDVRIEPGELQDFYMVQMPTAGTARIRAGREQVDAHRGLATIPDPTRPLRMHWSGDCAKTVLRIDRRRLEQHLAATLGRPLAGSIGFRLDFDLTSSAGRSWLNLVGYLQAELLADGAALGNRLFVAQLEQFVMSKLLALHEHRYSQALAALDSPAAPRCVKVAEEYIRAHADLPLSIDDLVAATGASAQRLYHGFRRFRGTTPMKFLLATRLERVRAELEAAAPGASVTAIASRWGFTQLGRFAGLYRQRYGESPSTTLQRG